MTLGQVLKNKRLELGKSLAQISTATRIHVKVLSALEEDRYAELPARAFTRGFIIAYCKTLQLNSNEILRDYHDFLESKFSERPERDHGHQGYVFERKENEQNRRWLIISASGAALFAILTLLFFKPQNHKRKEKHREFVSEEAEIQSPVVLPTVTPTITAAITATVTPIVAPSATPTPTTTPAPTVVVAKVATPTPTPSPVASPSPTTNLDPLRKGDDLDQKDAGVKISIEVLETTLIHYRVDQKQPFSITLVAGKSLVIKGKELVRVYTANPERLKYKVNSKAKANYAYNPMKQSRIEARPDGIERSFEGTP